MNESVIQFGPNRGLVGVFTEPNRTLKTNTGTTDCADPKCRDCASQWSFSIATSISLVHSHGKGIPVCEWIFPDWADSNVRTDVKDGDNRALLDAQDAMEYLRDQNGCNEFVVIGPL